VAACIFTDSKGGEKMVIDMDIDIDGDMAKNSNPNPKEKQPIQRRANDYLSEGIDKKKTRLESDSIGNIEVPAEHYWGAQTQRSLIDFSIGDDRMPKAVYHAYGFLARRDRCCNKHFQQSIK
jgi:hypothetical protein